MCRMSPELLKLVGRHLKAAPEVGLHELVEPGLHAAVPPRLGHPLWSGACMALHIACFIAG